jgi:hypothetical protein
MGEARGQKIPWSGGVGTFWTGLGDDCDSNNAQPAVQQDAKRLMTLKLRVGTVNRTVAGPAQYMPVRFILW